MGREDIIHLCVDRYPCAIGYLDDATEEDYLAAVKKDGLALSFINETVSSRVELHAVRQNGMALMHVEDKTHDVIMVALLQDPHAIIFLENPSDDYKKVACGLGSGVYRYAEAEQFLDLGDETVFG